MGPPTRPPDPSGPAMHDVLTPKEIEETSFPDGEGGYDRLHVDAFLKTMAAQVRRLQRELDVALERGEAPYRAAGKEIGDLIQNAKDRAAELVVAAEDVAQGLLKDAHNDVMVRRQEADAMHKGALRAQQEFERERDQILAAAHSEAAAIVERARGLKQHLEAQGRVMLQEAEREVRRLKQETKKEADQARAAAERQHAELSSRLERRIRALQEAENVLSRRVAALKADREVSSGEGSSGDAATLPEPDSDRP